ncbi:hypothetical protein IKE84_02010 [Candidatus Saccharibacteria bacterium]|nr:hypothetical protein [Candidatus Saccharibacteria bacterium]
MDRENYLQTLEALIKTNASIAASSASEHEAKLLKLENMAYQEVIQKIKNGAYSFDEQKDEELEATWLAEVGLINHARSADAARVCNATISHRTKQATDSPQYDRYGLPVDRERRFFSEFFERYHEEEWGETDEVYRLQQSAKKHGCHLSA